VRQHSEFVWSVWGPDLGRRRPLARNGARSAIRLLLGLFLAAMMGPACRAKRDAPGVATRTASGNALCWPDSSITFELRSSEPSRGLLEQAVDASIAAWNEALRGCGAPRLHRASALARANRVARDGISQVRLRTDAWCPEGAPHRTGCYDPTRAAKTHLYPNESGTGRCAELREADIEINGVDFSWSLEGDSAGTRSLRAVISHEMGHALGLDHPCSEQPQPNSPACDTPELRSALMYPVPAELGREPVFEPTGGEASAVCALYRQR
jgi:hypothetical protein